MLLLNLVYIETLKTNFIATPIPSPFSSFSASHAVTMSTNRCSNHNTVPPDSKDNGLKFFPYFAFFNLTISSLGTIYRAYTHNDIPMIAFIVFVYFAYFWLDHCFTAINKLPPSNNSSKKKRLQFTVWILSTAILFGFACEFATFLNLPATLSISGISIAISFCLFYSYFIRDNQTITG